MGWEFPVITHVLTAYILHRIVLKKVVGLPGRTRRLAWMFGFCIMFAVLHFTVTAEDVDMQNWDSMLVVCGIGIINSFAAYASWRATDISLSITSLFTQADDLIGIGLAVVILDEARYTNSLLAAAIVLCITTAAIFPIACFRSQDSQDKQRPKWGMLAIWIAIYSVIWGGAYFAIRFFAVHSLPLAHFTIAWYSGAFVGSLIIRLFFQQKRSCGRYQAQNKGHGSNRLTGLSHLDISCAVLFGNVPGASYYCPADLPSCRDGFSNDHWTVSLP